MVKPTHPRPTAAKRARKPAPSDPRLALANSTARKYLRALVRDVREALAMIDAEMRGPSTVERGKRIASICNTLELANDCGERFGLGESKGRKLRR